MAKRRKQIIQQEKRRQSHKILNHATIPRRQDGNRLGARKRIDGVRMGPPISHYEKVVDNGQ